MAADTEVVGDVVARQPHRFQLLPAARPERSVTSHGTRSAAPSSRLATPYMPIGNTMLHIPGS